MRDVSPNLNVLEVIQLVFKKGIVVDFDKFFVVAWSLWGWQNRSIFDHQEESPM